MIECIWERGMVCTIDIFGIHMNICTYFSLYNIVHMRLYIFYFIFVWRMVVRDLSWVDGGMHTYNINVRHSHLSGGCRYLLIWQRFVYSYIWIHGPSTIYVHTVQCAYEIIIVGILYIIVICAQ